MISDIKIFKSHEGGHCYEPMSMKSHDAVISHTNYDDLMQRITELASNNDLEVQLKEIWQNCDRERVSIAESQDYSKLSPHSKICVWFKYYNQTQSTEDRIILALEALRKRVAALEDLIRTHISSHQ